MKTTLWLTSVGFLLLASCASFDKVVQKPSVEIDSIHVEDPSLTALTMVFGIRVDNPNAFSIPVSNLNYDLKVNGQNLAAGALESPGKLPPRGKAVVKVPVRVSYFSLYNTAKAISDNKRVSYEIKGDLDAGGVTVPFNDVGTVNLPTERVQSE